MPQLLTLKQSYRNSLGEDAMTLREKSNRHVTRTSASLRDGPTGYVQRSNVRRLHMHFMALDTGADRGSFNTNTMLHCPRCNSLAWSRPLVAGAKDWFAPRRLTCEKCSYTKLWQARAISRAPGEFALDDYFHLPLYLQAKCSQGVVWAYNVEHLEYLRDWLEAPLRVRRKDERFGWSNSSYLSRLPRWVKLAKNRAKVLEALKKLRVLAEAATPDHSIDRTTNGRLRPLASAAHVER